MISSRECNSLVRFEFRVDVFVILVQKHQDEMVRLMCSPSLCIPPASSSSSLFEWAKRDKERLLRSHSVVGQTAQKKIEMAGKIHFEK